MYLKRNLILFGYYGFIRPKMEFKSSNYSEAFKKFANWIESKEERLKSACHCCPQTKKQAIHETPTPLTNGIVKDTIGVEEETGSIAITTTSQSRIQHWKVVIDYHQDFQNEVEDFGKQLNCELKRHLNEDKSCTSQQLDESARLEARWHQIWLKSLEQLVIVERTRRCPQHNTTIIGKPTPSASSKSMVRPQRIRPISYPNNTSERLEWDYKYTLSLTGCHKENGSHIDLDSVDEQTTKNLTEFGENYEIWFGKEDEVACIPTHSRPPSVEPAEKPEIAKAVVFSDKNAHKDVGCNLLMLTTPSSMFSVDASKCSHNKKRGSRWQIIGSFLIAVVLVVISALYHEPHQMHRSYYHSQPPV